MDVESEHQHEQQTSIGQLLKQARESRQLSCGDIARQLNLTVTMIQSIEADAPAGDTPMTFIRGYIRAYATKVGLDSELIGQLLAKQYGSVEPPIQKLEPVSEFKVYRREINSRTSWFRFVTVVIIAALVGLAGWEIWHRMQSSDDAATEVVTLDEVDAANEAVSLSSLGDEEASDAAVHTVDNGNTIEEPQAAAGTKVQDTAKAEPASEVVEAEANAEVLESVEPLAEPLSLVFDFSGDCWVEIVDATGETLAIGIKRAGKHMPISGVPPIRVKLGAPGVVQLSINGEPYDLSQYPPTRTATFTIGQ